MSNITVTIGGASTYAVMENTLTTDETQDGRSVVSFDVKDLAGNLTFQPLTAMSVADSLTGYSYSGFINDVTITPLPPGPARIHTLNCIDGHWLPDKRYYSGPEYINRYAGDIATDLLGQVLASEGITAAYAVDNDQSLADWQQGTLTATTATNNVSGGDLELASAGISVTKLDSTTANWQAGTLTNTSGANNALTLAGINTIKFTSQCNGTSGSRIFNQIWKGSYAIVSGDTLSYSMWIDGTSPASQAYVHLHCSNGGNTGGLQDFFLLNEENSDLSGYAKNQWYARTVDLTPLAGATLTNAFVCFDAGSQGTYTAYFHDVKVVNGVTTKVTIFSSSLNSNVISQDIGYNQTICSVVTASDPVSGTRVSPSTSLTPVGILQDGAISWQETIPNNSTLIVSTSLDGGVTWVSQSNNSMIAGILAGANASGLTLLTQVAMTITGNDPTATPSISTLQCVINPSYQATKTDITYTKHLTADFGVGTSTNVLVSNNTVTLNGFWRSWSDGLFPNQTLFGNTTPGQSSFHRAFVLTNAGNSDVRSRFDFVGLCNILDMSISHDIPTTGGTTANGLVYGTTNWGNSNDSYAYSVTVSSTTILFGKGNNSTGAGAFTSLASFTFPTALSANSWHTLRIQWNGTASTQNGIPAHTHNIYVDGVLYISQVDATFTGVGNVGARMYNNSGVGVFQQGHFSNFSLVQSYVNTTWVSPTYSLNSVGTCGNSLFTYTATIPASSSLLAETTIDGGSTWQTATSGGPISGLSNGVNLSGKNLQVRFTFTEGIGQETILNGFTAWIMSQFNSSGNRISEVLSFAPIGRIGSSLVSWSAIQPPSTSIFVDTSPDGSTWTNNVAPGTPIGTGSTSYTGSGSIAGITTQSDPMIDGFATNTNANYTSTFMAGGALATWTWDTANSRLTASGGTNAHLLYNTPYTAADCDISFVSDQSDNAGFVWRWTDQSNFYSLAIHDASNGTVPNTIQLFKTVAGVKTQIGSNYTISFTRGTYHTFRLTHIGTALILLMDGVSVFSVTENSITASGFTGLRTDTSGGSSAHFYTFRQQYIGQDVSTTNVYSRVRLISTDPTVTPQVLNLSVSGHDQNIQNGALIPQTSYSILNGNKTTLAGAFDGLAKQSGNYWWKIKNGKLLFQAQQATPAPWVITGNDTLTTNITLDNVNDHYRNSQWLPGGLDIVAQSRSFVGDGVKASFDLPYPVDSMTSITVNNVLQTFGIKGVDTNRQWYYKQGDSNILQDTSLADPLNTLQVLTVSFNGQVPITVNIQRPSEITRIAALDGSSGIVDEGEDGAGLNKAALIAKGDGLLTTFTPAYKTLKFSTLRSGLSVGQLLTAFINPLGISDGAFLITEVKGTYQPTVTNGTKTETCWYDVTAVAGPLVGSWTRWIANLASL